MTKKTNKKVYFFLCTQALVFITLNEWYVENRNSLCYLLSGKYAETAEWYLFRAWFVSWLTIHICIQSFKVSFCICCMCLTYPLHLVSIVTQLALIKNLTEWEKNVKEEIEHWYIKGGKMYSKPVKSIQR